MNTLKVTHLEKQVLEALGKGMFAEFGYSDVGIEEIARDTNLSHKVIRGVASSLIKKGLIEIDDREDEGYKNKHEMHIWYLTNKTYGLAEVWLGEDDWKGNPIQKLTLLTD